MFTLPWLATALVLLVVGAEGPRRLQRGDCWTFRFALVPLGLALGFFAMGVVAGAGVLLSAACAAPSLACAWTALRRTSRRNAERNALLRALWSSPKRWSMHPIEPPPPRVPDLSAGDATSVLTDAGTAPTYRARRREEGTPRLLVSPAPADDVERRRVVATLACLIGGLAVALASGCVVRWVS